MSPQSATGSSRSDTRWERTPGAAAHTGFRFFVLVILLSTVSVLLLYVGHFFRADFSSDDAVLNLLAQAMYEQGRLFPKGWVTNNGDLMMPSGALLLAPLLHWWPNGFAAHAFVSIVLSVSLLAIVAGFLRLQRLSWTAVSLVLILLASGFTTEFTIMVFGQTTYFWWPAGFLLGASLLLLHHRRREMFATDARRWTEWRLIALFVLVAVISLANPNRVAVMMVLPLIAFDRTLVWQALPAEARRARTLATDAWPASLALLGGLAIAWLSYRLLMRTGVTATQHFVSALTPADWNSIREHLRIFVNGWFDYIGGSPRRAAGQPWEPFLRTVRTAIAVALSAVFVLEIRDWRRDPDPVRRALFVSFLAAMAPLLVLFILFDPLAIDMMSLRYFTVPYVLLVVLAGYRFERWLHRPSGLTLILVAGGCLLVLGGTVHRMLPFGATFWTTRDSGPMNLAPVLQREGLSRGYATWWNAGATTVLSNMAVRVDPVMLTPTLLHAFPVMVDRSWFEPSDHFGPTFLALSGAETLPAQLVFLETRLGRPARVISEAGYRIQIYDHNISTDFTCLDMRPLLDEPLADVDYPRVRILSAELVRAPGADVIGLRLRIRNDSERWIGAAGALPVTVGLHLKDAQGILQNYDWQHAPLNCPLAPGQTRTIGTLLPKTSPGSYRIAVDLVQEGVGWFTDKGGVPMELPMEIR